ncbi:TlpA family protein disulfide reductase [Cohnella sp. GCM10020058]|uniref:TlpA family protein disulfide reductase n=1 Tax=Cohnella sp. GCM10020058 TaxID=3317330 RepID=UPI00363CBB76
MSDFFFFSYWTLWGVVALLAYAVLAMMKRLYRISLPASDRGLPVGAPFPLVSRAAGIAGGEQPPAGIFAIFTAADCHACKQAYPVVEQFRKRYPRHRFELYMLASEEEGARIVQAHASTLVTTFVDDLESYEVPGVPFAYYLAGDGTVLSKGVFHESAHLEHLIAIGKKAMRRSA